MSEKVTATEAKHNILADAPPTHGFGPVTIRPNDQRYRDLVTGDNQRWVASPDYIQIVGSTQQVIDTVQVAVRTGRRLSVRSGGHCFEDFVSNPEVRVLIDMSGMNAVYYDRKMRAFAIEPAATILDVYETLYKGWGVTIPGGSCYSVGAGGHICGGGYGLLSRRHGLTVDHLYAVEVVVVEKSGKVRSVVATRDPRDPNHDLWWAHTGGGGGNFGVITRYWMRSPGASGDDPSRLLPNPPDTVLLNGISFSWADLNQERFGRLLKNYGRWYESNSTPNSPAVALSSSLALNHKSNGSVALFTQVEGTAPNAEQLLVDFVSEISNGVEAEAQPITGQAGEYGPMPDLFNVQRLPWLHATRYIGTNTPVLTNPTLRAEHKSAYLRRNFTEADVATMYKFLISAKIDNPSAMLSLLSFGGNINAVEPSATAVAQRSSVLKALYQSFWSDASDDAENLAWTREFYGEVYAASGGVPIPNDRTDGCYINYPDTDLSDPAFNSSEVPWHGLYYKDNYLRLQQVKARWDPKNIFRHSQSIELPS